MGNFFEEELKKQLELEMKKKAEEDDDQNFIRKDEPQEETKKTKEKDEEKSVGIIGKLQNLVFPKNNQQRNLARETGGLEAAEKKEIKSKDAWDGRSEEVDKMGSTDVFNTTGMRSVIWRKKREKLAAKQAMDAAAAIGTKLKGKVVVQDGLTVAPTQGYVARLKNLRQDRSGLGNDNNGMSR